MVHPTLAMVGMQTGIIHVVIGLGVVISGGGGAVLGKQLTRQSELGGLVLTSASGVITGIGVWVVYVVLSHALSARSATLIIIVFVLIEAALSIAIYRTGAAVLEG